MVALSTVPPKPGLVRVPHGGASVAGELWELPRADLGPFLAALPSPMALGRVHLSDGREVTGFLCEQVAAERGEDITAYASWAAYLAATRPPP